MNDKKNIFCIFGPSGSGKDTFVKDILKEIPELKFQVPLTTRPKRSGEVYGKEYFFISKEKMEAMIASNQLMEHRKYNVLVDEKPDVWYYGNEIPIADNSIIIGTPEVVRSLVKFTDEHEDQYNFFTIYLLVEEKERLSRMIKREALNEEPNWDELVRRFFADQEDFSGVGTIWNPVRVSFLVKNANGSYIENLGYIVDFIRSKIG